MISYDFDDRGLPKTILSNGIIDQQYQFYADGNLEYRQDLLTNHKESFTYTTNNQLETWNIKRGVGEVANCSMSYDVHGNITGKSDLNNYTMNYGEGEAGPHAITSISGNPSLIGGDDQIITYTDFKKIKTITEGNKTLTLKYGIDEQRRIGVFNSGMADELTRYYLGDYEEDHTNGNVKKIHYISGGNGLASMYIEENGVGTLNHVYTDYLGSINAVKNANSNEVERLAFDPWGNRRNPNKWEEKDSRTTWLTDRGFTMHEHLDAFALINMNGRVYDPALSRFLSPDPQLQSPGNWLNYNRYAYGLNNPMLYTDPSGEFFWVALPLMVKIGIGIGAGLGAYSGYKIGEANGASGSGMLGYVLGGAAIGGFSGYLGGTIAAGGGFMANTAAIMAGSYTNSVSMAALSGGQMTPSISFGAASYNFETGELGHLGKDGNSFMEDLGYGLGALANLNDLNNLINQTSATLYTQERYQNGSKDYVSHSGIVDNATTDKLMSFGPMGKNSGVGRGYDNIVDQIGEIKGIKPLGDYKKFGLSIRKSTTGYGVPMSLSKSQSVVVNKHLFSGLRGVSKILPYQGLTTNCVNMSSIGLWLNGIPNIGIHPYLLHYSAAAYYGGFRPDIFSYHLNNF